MHSLGTISLRSVLSAPLDHLVKHVELSSEFPRMNNLVRNHVVKSIRFIPIRTKTGCKARVFILVREVKFRKPYPSRWGQDGQWLVENKLANIAHILRYQDTFVIL